MLVQSHFKPLLVDTYPQVYVSRRLYCQPLVVVLPNIFAINLQFPFRDHCLSSHGAEMGKELMRDLKGSHISMILPETLIFLADVFEVQCSQKGRSSVKDSGQSTNMLLEHGSVLFR